MTHGSTSPPQRARRPVLLAAAAVALVAALTAALAVVVRALPAPGGQALPFSWSVPQRFGADANHDGLVDYDTSAAYLDPASWPLQLDACAAPAVARHPLAPTVTWRISGAALPRPRTVTAGCAATVSVPRLGRYRVSAALGRRSMPGAAQDVTLKDVFLVSVGDSVASGEGNPDVTPPAPRWEDQQCHRSALAGPARAALRLERRDPHTSVTFLHLACSGATIARGLLGPYAGIDPRAGGHLHPALPPQLDEAVRLAHGRRIDAVLVSIGANDLGFGDIVKSCVLLPSCDTGAAAQKYAAGIAALPAQFAALNTRLDDLTRRGLIGTVAETQYFDVAEYDDGSICPAPTWGGNSFDGLSTEESRWTHDVVSPGLNAAVGRAVDAGNLDGGARWVLVDGIAAEFARHGYCADDHWIRRLGESLRMQRDQFGAFHPNAAGQLLGYARRIEAVLAPLDGIGGQPLPFN